MLPKYMWVILTHPVDQFPVYEFQFLRVWKPEFNKSMRFFSRPYLAWNFNFVFELIGSGPHADHSNTVECRREIEDVRVALSGPAASKFSPLALS